MTATLLRRAGYQSGGREGPCAARLARSRRRGEASRERDRRAARRLRVVPSASGTSMPQHHGRRGPRTIPAVGISSATCWNDQLTRGPQIPDLDVGMGDIEGAWLDELRRIASVSPQGQKRILVSPSSSLWFIACVSGPSVVRPGSMRGAALCGCARCTAASMILTMMRTPDSLIFTRSGGC